MRSTVNSISANCTGSFDQNKIPFNTLNLRREQFGYLVAMQAVGFVFIQFTNGLWFALPIYPGSKTFTINPDPIAIIPLVRDTRLQPVTQCAFGNIQLFANFTRGYIASVINRVLLQLQYEVAWFYDSLLPSNDTPNELIKESMGHSRLVFHSDSYPIVVPGSSSQMILHQQVRQIRLH